MCIVKTPKVTPTDPQAKTPEPIVIRNPYLDGVDPVTKALRKGRSSLRIERAGAGASPSPPATALPPTATPNQPQLPAVQPALPRITRGGQRGGGDGRGGRLVER